ncbi:MAG: serine hydrolase domain-containing protein [Victivallaceae bacterium]|jgi:CubicO group peptidase (beta-lactamase class C family)
MDINSPAQQQIQSVLNDSVERGIERGIQVAAYLDGKLVIDAWAGIADPDTGREVTGDTLFPVFSAGKGITATAVHILAEQGKLDYDTPIAACWPEFGKHGKDRITLRQALSHTAGIPHMPFSKDVSEVCDWELMCRKIAGLQPLWEPGTKTSYHAITFSWIIGETARRLDGRDISTIIREEICRPLGINSIFIGIPDSLADQTATLDVPEYGPNQTPPVFDQSIPSWVCPLEVFMNNPEVRRACIPASNGIMNARGIARHYAALIGNGVDGVRLLSPETILAATTLTSPAGIPVAELPNKFGLGYGLSGPDEDYGQIFGHGGYGGTVGIADRKTGLTLGVTRNRTYAGGSSMISEVRAALGLQSAAS